LIVLSLRISRRFAWLALFALVLQAGLPTLRIAAAKAGELRAESILATSLCSKPAFSLADGVDALLRPWQEHGSKKQHHHCDSCLQNVDAPAFIDSSQTSFRVSLKSTGEFSDLLGVALEFQSSRFPPPRGPPALS
jgi:Protein of unknown function (DUF2946)